MVKNSYWNNNFGPSEGAKIPVFRPLLKIVLIRIKIVEKKSEVWVLLLEFLFKLWFEHNQREAKYVEIFTWLSILKGAINIELNMNSYWLEKSEMESLAFAFLPRNSTWLHC